MMLLDLILLLDLDLVLTSPDLQQLEQHTMLLEKDVLLVSIVVLNMAIEISIVALNMETVLSIAALNMVTVALIVVSTPQVSAPLVSTLHHFSIGYKGD